MPTPSRGSESRTSPAVLDLTGVVADAVVSSASAATAGSSSPRPAPSFAATVLAALASGQPGQSADADVVTESDTGATATSPPPTHSGTGQPVKTRAAGPNKTLTASALRFSGFVLPTPAAIIHPGKAPPSAPSNAARAAPTTEATTPSTGSSAPSLPDPMAATISPIIAHAGAGPDSTAVWAATNPTNSMPTPSTSHTPAAMPIAQASPPALPSLGPTITAADTPSTGAAATATVTQVAGALAQLPQPGASDSATTITLHLAPPALGNVAIRIIAPTGATPVVTITATHQASAEALATARPNLEASLVRAGLPADTRVIVHLPETPSPSGQTFDRGSRQPGGQPRRPPQQVQPQAGTGLDFAETLDISA